MAADQERADRVRALKQDRPDLTWRRVAEHVGVSERAAINWQKDGGMDYANAEKLAELFEVDVDYIWRGTENNTPDLSLNGAGESQLDRIETKLDTILDLLSGEDDGRLDETIRRVRESLRRPAPQSSPARAARTKR